MKYLSLLLLLVLISCSTHKNTVNVRTEFDFGGDRIEKSVRIDTSTTVFSKSHPIDNESIVHKGERFLEEITPLASIDRKVMKRKLRKRLRTLKKTGKDSHQHKSTQARDNTTLEILLYVVLSVIGIILIFVFFFSVLKFD